MREAWFVYIVECCDGSLYTGATPNVEQRLLTHNSGKGAKYTRARLPVSLKYQDCFEEKSVALKAERQIKKMSRAEKLHLISVHSQLV